MSANNGRLPTEAELGKRMLRAAKREGQDVPRWGVNLPGRPSNSDARRNEILRALANGPISRTALSVRLRINPATLDQNIGPMVIAGEVEKVKVGRTVFLESQVDGGMAGL